MPAKYVRKESKSRPGQFYYLNTETKVTTWDKPPDFNEKVCVVRPSRPISESDDEPVNPVKDANPKVQRDIFRRTGLFDKVLGRPGVPLTATTKNSQSGSKYQDATVLSRARYNSLAEPSCSGLRAYDNYSRNGGETNSLLVLAASYQSLLSTNTPPKTVSATRRGTVTNRRLKHAKSKPSSVPEVLPKRTKRSPPAQSSGTKRRQTSTNSLQDAQTVSASAASVSSGTSSRLPKTPSLSLANDSTNSRIHSWLNEIPVPGCQPEPTKPVFSVCDEEVDMEVDERLNSDLTQLRSFGDCLQNAGGATLQLLSQDMECGPSQMPPSQKELYLVLDTNVLLQNLKYVDSIKDEQLVPGFERPILVIPWVVVQELDALKDSKNNRTALSTQLKASYAVKHINNLLQLKHPRLQCQRPEEDRHMCTESSYTQIVNDDRVLFCTILWQMKKPEAEVFLLSLDKNLQNKGLIMSLKVQTLQEFVQWKNSMCVKTPPSSTSEQVPAPRKRKMSSGSSSLDSVTKKLEAQVSDDMMSIIKSVMRNSLSIVLEGCMEEIYKNIWLDIVIRKPPWSFMDVLACFEKHWLAVFRYKCHGTTIKTVKDCIKQLRDYEKEMSSYMNIRKILCFARSGKEVTKCFMGTRYGKEELKYTCSILDELIDMSDKFLMKNLQLNDCVSIVQGILQKVSGSQGQNIQDLHPGSPAEDAVSDSNFPNQQDLDADGDMIFAPEDYTADAVDRVKRGFQTCWEIIVKSTQHLRTRLGAVIQQGDIEQRKEPVYEFRSLMEYLWPFKKSYDAMLNDPNLGPESQTLEDLARALNAFAVKFVGTQVWENVTESQLLVFTQQQRHLLENASVQLLNYVNDLQGLYDGLLPPEQTVIQEVCT